MKPLLVLFSAFLITLFVFYFIYHYWNLTMAGNVGMSVMLLFTALGHFIFTVPMAKMLPPRINFRNEIVVITGLLEVFGSGWSGYRGNKVIDIVVCHRLFYSDTTR